MQAVAEAEVRIRVAVYPKTVGVTEDLGVAIRGEKRTRAHTRGTSAPGTARPRARTRHHGRLRIFYNQRHDTRLITRGAHGTPVC